MKCIHFFIVSFNTQATSIEKAIQDLTSLFLICTNIFSTAIIALVAYMTGSNSVPCICNNVPHSPSFEAFLWRIFSLSVGQINCSTGVDVSVCSKYELSLSLSWSGILIFSLCELFSQISYLNFIAGYELTDLRQHAWQSLNSFFIFVSLHGQYHLNIESLNIIPCVISFPPKQAI